MSTGNKKVYRRNKKVSEKDKRMAQLEKEIARLENENSKLKRDSVGYESRLAAFNGPTGFTTEFPSLGRNLQSDANKRVAEKSAENHEEPSRSKNNAEDGNRKKKLRIKLLKSSKKKDTSK